MRKTVPATPRRDPRRVADRTSAPAPATVTSLLRELRVCQAALSRSVAETHELRRELEALRARNAELHEHSPFAYVTLDHDSLIADANLSAAALLGVPRADLLGQPFARFTPVAAREPLARYLATVRQDDGRTAYEVELRRADGAPLHIHLETAGADAPDTGHVRLALVDITERARLESELRRVRHTELLGKITGAVVHDFNNLLMGILGSADVALAELGPPGPARDLVEQIRAAALRGSALTGKLLSLGHEAPDDVATDVDDAVRGSEAMLRGVLGERVELVVRAAGGGAHVRLDPSDIERILLNLVTNARRALADRGRVVVEATCLDFPSSAPSPRGAPVPGSPALGRYVMISVKDDGAGMDAATRRRMFEPFFSGNRGGRGTGLGLGLATVHQMVTDAGGHIQVQSRLGKGTTIRILLPGVDPAVPPRPTAPSRLPPAPLAPDAVVLLVEDNDMSRRALTIFLASRGHRVLSAAGAADALRLAHDHPGPIDAVVADLQLTDGTGDHVVAALRAAHPRIAAVFMSGRDPHDPIVRRALAVPDSTFLRKPFELDLLADQLHRLLTAPLSPAP